MNASFTNCCLSVSVSSMRTLVSGQSSTAVTTEMFCMISCGVVSELFPFQPRRWDPSKLPWIYRQYQQSMMFDDIGQNIPWHTQSSAHSHNSQASVDYKTEMDTKWCLDSPQALQWQYRSKGKSNILYLPIVSLADDVYVGFSTKNT